MSIILDRDWELREPTQFTYLYLTIINFVIGGGTSKDEGWCRSCGRRCVDGVQQGTLLHRGRNFISSKTHQHHSRDSFWMQQLNNGKIAINFCRMYANMFARHVNSPRLSLDHMSHLFPTMLTSEWYKWFHVYLIDHVVGVEVEFNSELKYDV